MYTELNKQGKLGSLTTKNRLVMSPMGIGLAELDGSPSQEMIDFYAARAEGGAGIVIPEITRINDVHGVGLLRQLSVTQDRHIKPLSRLAQAIHQYDSKLIIQLHHPGRETYSQLIGGQPVVAPSAIPCGLTKQKTRALENSEIKELVQQFIDGAKRVQKAGCDGVELHATHGYLLNQFLSPYTNKRTDEYGGSFENRLRFITEIIQGIRATCGTDFTLGVRLTVDEMLGVTGVAEPYIDLEMGIKIAQALEILGIDFLDVSCSIYESGIFAVEPTSFKQGWRNEMIKAVKSATNLPIIGVSLVREPAIGEAMLEDEIVDFVSMGRSWLADEQWGTKALSGRPEDIRRCITCLRCFESLNEYNAQGVPAECAVNPRCARERKYGQPEYVTTDKHVVIVGGGPSGMSAAITLAERGVKVTLLEQHNYLGGQVAIGKNPPAKDRLGWYIEDSEHRLSQLDVTIKLGVKATAATIAELNPDHVIIATGGQEIIPHIDGITGNNVYSVDEILGGQVALKNQKVAVIGAGMTGIETAEFLAVKQNAVTIVEMQDKIAPDGNPTLVLDVMTRLKRNQPNILLNHSLVAVSSTDIRVKAMESGQTQSVPVDSVVLALGYRATSKLYEQLMAGREYPVSLIGDASQIGKISSAVRAGYEIGRQLFAEQEEPSFVMKPEKLMNFSKITKMEHQKGVFMAYLTDPEAIAKILPPPLKPFSMPVVSVSVNLVTQPTFAKSYYEAILGIYCTYEGALGMYPVSLVLDGEGSEMATYLGRELTGIPKKLGAEFKLDYLADKVHVSLVRKGQQLLDAVIKKEPVNHPLYTMLMQAPAPEKTTSGTGFYFNYDFDIPEGSQQGGFCRGRLLANKLDTTYHKWIPGFTELDLFSSSNDPWGELPVRTVIGGAVADTDLALTGVSLAARPEITTLLPYLMRARFDNEAFMETGNWDW